MIIGGADSGGGTAAVNSDVTVIIGAAGSSVGTVIIGAVRAVMEQCSLGNR